MRQAAGPVGECMLMKPLGIAVRGVIGKRGGNFSSGIAANSTGPLAACISRGSGMQLTAGGGG